MNPQSEIILEKILDHFGEWEEPVEKKKITLKKKHKKVLKEKNFMPSQNIHLDDELVQKRRNELLLFIEELKLLNSNQDRKSKVSNEIYTKTRQAELIYARNVLQTEINNESFIQVF